MPLKNPSQLSYPNDLGKYHVKLVFKEYQYNINQSEVRTASHSGGYRRPPPPGRRHHTKSTRQSTTSVVQLPLPDGLIDNDTLGVSETELSGLGQGMATIANIAAESIKQGNLWGFSGFNRNSVKDAAAGMGVAALRQTLTAGGLATESQQGFQVGAGVTFNPYTALNFTGVQLKGHTLSWSNLAPRNRAEGAALHKIIKHIKRRAHPEYLRRRAFLSFPDVVEVTINGPDANQIVKFKPALISTIDVNYGPGGELSWLQGGTPTAINFSMNIKETQIWTKDDFSEDG